MVTLQLFIVLEFSSHALFGSATTFVMLVCLLHGMVGATSLPSFLLTFLRFSLGSKFSPRPTQRQKGFLVILSCQIGELLIDLFEKSDDIQPLLQKVLLTLRMVPQIVFQMAFSHGPGGLGCFEDSNSIPQNRTTTFHPFPTVAILLKYLLLLVERLLRRCHLSRIEEVLTCGISMISQIPSSCLCIQLSVCATAPRIFTNFSPSHVKI